MLEGSEHERAIDVSNLRNTTGCITLDDGYGKHGVMPECHHFHRRRKGILRYRGIPVDELAEKSTYVETAYLLIYGRLPKKAELQRFSKMLTHEREPRTRT